jgi:hypothetical protein
VRRLLSALFLLLPLIAHAEMLDHASSPLSTLGVQSSTAQLQACHPGVIDFLAEYDIAAWPVGHPDAHRFWAVYSSDEDCVNGMPENLYIQVSDDGINWEVSPFGLALVGSETQKRITSVGVCNLSYVSHQEAVVADGELIYDPWNDQLLVFGMRTEWPSAASSDAINYITRQTISNQGVVSSPTNEIGPIWSYDAPLMSPGVVYAGQDHLYMWAVEDDRWVDGVQEIYHTESTDNGVTWSTPTVCSPHTSTFWSGHYPWHLAAKLRPGGSGVVDLMVMSEPASGDYGDISSLLPVQTTLAAPTTLSAPLAPATILDKPPGTSAPQWDKGLYRSTFVPRWEDYELTWDVWYDGVTQFYVYDRVGFTSGGLGVYDGPAVDNNRPAGGYAEGTTITLSIPAGSTADSIEYGWGETEPVSPAIYTGPVEVQEGIFWWRGVDGATPGDWQSATYFVVYIVTIAGVSGTGAVGGLGISEASAWTSTDLLGNPIISTDLNGNPITSTPLGL